MASITIRNLPDPTKESLRLQAAQSGVSLEAHAREILMEAAKPKLTSSTNRSVGETVFWKKIWD